MLVSILKRMLGIQPPEPAYWWAIDDWWDSIDIYGTPDRFMQSFAQAPEYARHVFAAHWVVSEVKNGALPQFFYNSTGILAPEAQQALTVVGLKASAKALQSAMLALGEPYPRDTEVRMSLMASLYGTERSPTAEVLLDRMLDLTDDFLDGLGKGCKDFEPSLAAYAASFKPVAE